MVVTGTNKDVKFTKKMLNSMFDMKDMRITYVALGIKITKTFDGYTLSQSHYIDKILEKFGKDDRLAKTLVDVNLDLMKTYPN